MSTSPIRVFVVDDHPVVREGFRQLLKQKESLTVAGEASSGAETLEKLPQTEADLAIVDISMKEMGGIELTRRLQEKCPDLYTLVVSVHHETHYIEEALAAGAHGYVLKDNIHSILSEAIHAVISGERYLGKDVAQQIDPD